MNVCRLYDDGAGLFFNCHEAMEWMLRLLLLLVIAHKMENFLAMRLDEWTRQRDNAGGVMVSDAIAGLARFLAGVQGP